MPWKEVTTDTVVLCSLRKRAQDRFGKSAVVKLFIDATLRQPKYLIKVWPFGESGGAVLQVLSKTDDPRLSTTHKTMEKVLNTT